MTSAGILDVQKLKESKQGKIVYAAQHAYKIWSEWRLDNRFYKSSGIQLPPRI